MPLHLVQVETETATILWQRAIKLGISVLKLEADILAAAAAELKESAEDGSSQTVRRANEMSA